MFDMVGDGDTVFWCPSSGIGISLCRLSKCSRFLSMLDRITVFPPRAGKASSRLFLISVSGVTSVCRQEVAVSRMGAMCAGTLFVKTPFLLTEYHVHIIIYMLDLRHTNGLASAEPAVSCRSLKAKQEPVTERETRGIARIKRRTAIFLSGGSYGRMRQGLPKGIGKVGSSCSQKRLGTAFEINRRRETAGHSR